MQKNKRCGIIFQNSLKITDKGECIIILKPKLLDCTKELAKLVTIIILGFLFILAIIFIKYKPVYEVIVAGENLGYIENLDEFKDTIKEEIIEEKGKNIAYVTLKNEPEYEPKLLSRANTVSNEEIIQKIKENDVITTYKCYEVVLNNECAKSVETVDEAMQIVEKIKAEFSDEELDLDIRVNEKYSESLEEIKTTPIEVATTEIETVAKEIEEESKAIAIIKDVKFANLPVSGRITSRYGEASSLRRSKHTGLDIACVTGTDIKVVAGGTVTFAARNGSYGNLVKVDHGQGVETWYGHCSKIYAKVGDIVSAGDVIAAVGSTGNSTGPHLHFEIRIDSQTVNPQNYVY